MKKAAVIAIALIFVVMFSSCTVPPRPDFDMLSERLSAVDERYGFEFFDMFLYDGAYHTYLSLSCEKDVMLSMHIGDNGNIDDVTVTALAENIKTPDQKRELLAFMKALTSAFATLNDEEQQQIETDLDICNTDGYFLSFYRTCTASRYNFTFSSNEVFMCYRIEYFEEMTI